MNLFSIFFTAMAATTVMTVFSQLLSKIMGQEFEEPRLIGYLLNPSHLKREKPRNTWIAWLIHYCIGVIFLFFFASIWHNTMFQANILSGAVLGLLAGYIGVIGWKCMFIIRGAPPETPLGKYYIQLIIAHIFFGATAGLIYPFTIL